MSTRIDRVIITGASSGIGLDLAKRFLAKGDSRARCYRNTSRTPSIDRLAHGKPG